MAIPGNFKFVQIIISRDRHGIHPSREKPCGRYKRKANKDIKMMDSVHLIPERDRVIFQLHEGEDATRLHLWMLIPSSTGREMGGASTTPIPGVAASWGRAPLQTCCCCVAASLRNYLSNTSATCHASPLKMTDEKRVRRRWLKFRTQKRFPFVPFWGERPGNMAGESKRILKRIRFFWNCCLLLWN